MRIRLNESVCLTRLVTSDQGLCRQQKALHTSIGPSDGHGAHYTAPFTLRLTLRRDPSKIKGYWCRECQQWFRYPRSHHPLRLGRGVDLVLVYAKHHMKNANLCHQKPRYALPHCSLARY